MSFFWSDAEDLLMKQNPRLDRAELVELLVQHGFRRRTEGAVKSRRSRLDLPPAPARQSINLSNAGWPVVSSNPIEQDRNYMRALVRDLQQRREAA